MIFTIHDDVFAAEGAGSLELLALFEHGFWLIDGAGHQILTDPVYQPGQQTAVQEWLQEQHEDLVEILVEVLESSIELHSNAVTYAHVDVVAAAEDYWEVYPPRLTLKTALRLARCPLGLMVENESSDGSFLCAVAPERYRETFHALLREDRLRFEQAGGVSEIPKLLKPRGKVPFRRHRTFALFDNDAADPDTPSDDARRTLEACEEHLRHRLDAQGIFDAFHQLERRAIENYIPIPALSAWIGRQSRKRKPSLRAALNTYRALSEEQRRYFPLKKGFSHGQVSETLYEDLEEEREHLASGFGSDIAEIFEEEYRQDNALAPLWEQWLDNDGQRDEINQIFDAIFAWI